MTESEWRGNSAKSRMLGQFPTSALIGSHARKSGPTF